MEIRNPNIESRKKSEERKLKIAAVAIRRRSAELHSAVSQICNLQDVGSSGDAGVAGRLAECNSAIQQITNLRYERFTSCQALLHFQSSGAAHSRAFTGLFAT